MLAGEHRVLPSESFKAKFSAANLELGDSKIDCCGNENTYK